MPKYVCDECKKVAWMTRKDEDHYPKCIYHCGGTMYCKVLKGSDGVLERRHYAYR
jgi:hypothetical protein